MFSWRPPLRRAALDLTSLRACFSHVSCDTVNHEVAGSRSIGDLEDAIDPMDFDGHGRYIRMRRDYGRHPSIDHCTEYQDKQQALSASFTRIVHHLPPSNNKPDRPKTILKSRFPLAAECSRVSNHDLDQASLLSGPLRLCFPN